ncbi:hypothetical protein, partial [Burkholderia ubonensis]|uniref:hypothetical protein n=1 Tax=Burkholderia ubonensis TaxID=101571 RepID=UPI000A5190D8
EGYKPLNKIKKKSDCASSKEYYQQFADYKMSSMDHDVGISAYYGLLSLGLSDHEIAAAIPYKIIYCQGVKMHYRASDEIMKLLDNGRYRNRRNKFENHLNEGVDITGPITFIGLDRNRILAISEVGGEIVMHMFGPDEIQSSDALKIIKDSRTLLDKYWNPYFIQELEGRELINNILKPLFGSRLDYNRRGYPILRGDGKRAYASYTGPKTRALTGIELLPIVEEAVKDNMGRIVSSVKMALDDKTFWDNVLSFIPFYDEIYKSVNDPLHKLDVDSIMLDVVGVVSTIVPAVGPLTKLGKAGQAILQKAVLSNIGRGLTGKDFARGVLSFLAKEAPALQKLGLKGLSHVAFVATDLVSPIPPELLVSPVVRMTKNIRAYFEQQRHLNGRLTPSMGGRLPANGANNILINAVEGELEAIERTATIATSADKSITIRGSVLTPGQTIEESNALFHPLPRKQPSVMRAGEVAPYSFDLCSPGRGRVKRGIGDELCGAEGLLNLKQQKLQAIADLSRKITFTEFVESDEVGLRNKEDFENDVIRPFKNSGLLARTVQDRDLHYMFENYDQKIEVVGRDGYLQKWSLTHESLSPNYYLMGDPSKPIGRGIAVLADPEKFGRHIVAVHSSDAFSGRVTDEMVKRGSLRPDDFLAQLNKVKVTLQAKQGVIGKNELVDNSEIQSVGVNQEAFVGFMYSPSRRIGSVEGAVNVIRRQLAEAIYNKAGAEGIGSSPFVDRNFPFFTYKRAETGGATLEYIGNINVSR